jgi:hypothetical protein
VRSIDCACAATDKSRLEATAGREGRIRRTGIEAVLGVVGDNAVQVADELDRIDLRREGGDADRAEVQVSLAAAA